MIGGKRSKLYTRKYEKKYRFGYNFMHVAVVNCIFPGATLLSNVIMSPALIVNPLLSTQSQSTTLLRIIYASNIIDVMIK